MKDIVFVTGNANKAKFFAKLSGLNIDHHGLDLPEIQSLDLEDVVTDKAKKA